MMSQPPPLPKRNVAQDRSQNAVPVPTSQPKRVVDAPPELPSRKQVPAPDVLSATAGGEASDQTAYPKAMKEPTARRFVAPIPVPSTPPQSTITSTFRAWLDLLPSRRPDTPEEANIRRKLEEQQIARYMNSFSKHVQYLRMDSGYATQRSIQDGAGRLQRKPDLDDFRSAPLGDKDKIEAVGLETSDTDQRQSSQAGPGAVEAPIDWFGYYAALAVYHLHCYFPSLASNNIQPLHLTSKSIEREPFTVSRLRSSVERLLVNARSPWQKTFVTIGQVAMWHDVAKSLKWLFIYILLTITSTFTPFFLSIPLYHLLYVRLFPPSVSDLLQQEVDAAKRSEEGHELAEDIVQPEESSASIPGGLGGDYPIGAIEGFALARDAVNAYTAGTQDVGGPNDAVNVDILRPHVQSVVNRVLPVGSAAPATKDPTGGADEDPKAKEKKGKAIDAGKAKSKVPGKTTKLRQNWEAFKDTNGVGLIVVLDDLADMHERVESLFAWRRPESSTKFALILLCAIIASHLIPALWMLKIFQIAVGIVFFVVIPVVARMEKYEPISVSLTDAPTMAEHVINVMRNRASRGEPMPVYRPPTKTPSRKTTAMSSVKSATAPSNASTESLSLTTTEIEDELVRIDSNSETVAAGSSAGERGGGKRKVDWGGMRDQALAHAQTGSQWWQTGKDLWKGEKKVQFSWKGNREDWENVEKSALAAKQVSLGPNGPGLHLSVHSTEEPSTYVKEGISYLARHAGYTGSLYLSPKGLMFVPLISSGKVADKATEDVLQDSVRQENTAEKEGATENRRPEVQVPMSSIVGMRKSNKTAMGCIVSAGLQIDVDDGSTIVFPFVASRDTVFNRLLALSEGTFRRV